MLGARGHRGASPLHGARARAPPRQRAAAVSSDAPVSAVPAAEAQPDAVAPEDLVLAPGELSPMAPGLSASPADVFRCAGCVLPDCQARLARSCPRPAACWAAGMARTRRHPLSRHAQGPHGCAPMAWRFDQIGYLRHILTARVYDVAVRSASPPSRTTPPASHTLQRSAGCTPAPRILQLLCACRGICACHRSQSASALYAAGAS